MARQLQNRNIRPILDAAEQWINSCLIHDGAVFVEGSRWTSELVDEVFEAFVTHPDIGDDDFMTKLKGQMNPASAHAQQLMAEMLWALLLFPSNMKARTKRQQVSEIWSLSGQQLNQGQPLLSNDVLIGIGSSGPGFNNYRPDEMTFLIALVRDLKGKGEEERRSILFKYDAFLNWIGAVPRKGSRQFRHMLRFFAFPDRVERISSNNDRRKILVAFDVAPSQEVAHWKDQRLDTALTELRSNLQRMNPSTVLDFYEPPLREKWASDRKIKTVRGEVSVTVPADEDEVEDKELVASKAK
jgi:hypothetical protein